MRTQPRGHFALMADGSLTIIVDGVVRDSPHAVNIAAVKAELERGAPIVVYGIGAGQLVTSIRSLSESARGQASPILVYEPDPGILASFMQLGLPCQGVSIACDIEDFRAMFQFMLQGRSTVSLFHNSFTVNAVTKVEFDEFVDTVRRIVDAEQVTMNTITVRMPEWVRNVCNNLAKIPGCKPLMALTGEFRGVPAFIVGAGPSLKVNGHLLSTCAKKGLVFTVDVAARAFKRVGAEPHIFVAVEGQDLSAHLEGIEWIDRVPRAFSLEANPAVLACGNGPLLPWIDSNYSFNDVCSNVLMTEGLPIGGSVTTAAFLMAEAFGCGPIVMLGQDLANTGGKRAAEGVLSERLSHLQAHGSTRKWGVEHYSFNPRSRAHYWDEIEDTPQWLHARVWFEQRASVILAREPAMQLINCTEGGSHIIGFDDVPLNVVLDQLPDRDIDVMGKLANVSPISNTSVEWYCTRQREMLAPIVDKARSVSSACTDVAKLIHEGNGNADVTGAMQARGDTENEFRLVAQASALFIGSAQMYLKGLNDLREEAARKETEGAQAAEFFESEAMLFTHMGDLAQQLFEGIVT